MSGLKTAIFVATVMGVSLPATADAIRDLMVRAIDAGVATGELNDATAKIWQQKSGSNSPVNARVEVVKRFQQEGCARLYVQLWQNNMPTTDGRKINGLIPFQINLCRDGSPPLEGVDRKLLQEEARRQQEAMKAQGRAQ